MSYTFLERDRAVIGNGLYEMTVSLKDGGLLGLVNKSTGAQYVLSPGKPMIYLWTLLSDKRDSGFFANEGESYKVRTPRKENFAGATSSRDNNLSRLILKYSFLGGIRVEIEFRAEKGSPLLEARLQMFNGCRDWDRGRVVAVGFPELHGIAIGGSCRDNVLVRPNRFGEKIVDPVEKAGTYTVNLCYGGYASMQWMDMYSRLGGLYLASYDKTLTLCELESEPDLETETMRLGIRKYVYVPPGAAWTSEPYVIGVHTGDWHWAADRYREWAESWMRRPRIPEWLKESDGWYGIGFHHGGKRLYRFRDIPEIFEEAVSLGLNQVQFWGQMAGPCRSCCYRFYYPDPRLGGAEELAKAVRQVRKQGGHVGFYFNIQAFDPMLPRLPENLNKLVPEHVEIPGWDVFRRYAQLHFDGSYVRQYPGRPGADWADGFRIMCPCAQGWRNYLKHWILKYVKEYGADVIYLDQAASPPVTYCFNFEHGHVHHGDVVKCRVELVKEIVEAVARVNPDAVVVVEGNGDAIGQYAHVHLYTSFSTQTRYPCPEVFYYTFPYYVIFDGFANPPTPETIRNHYPDANKELTFEDVLNKIFLLGLRFDLCLYRRLRINDKLAVYFRKVLNLRRKIKNYLVNSRFIDDILLVSRPRLVEAKLFLGEGFLIVTLLDIRVSRSRFKLILNVKPLGFKAVRRALLYTLESEKPLDVDITGGKLVIDVPPLNGLGAIIVEYL